jgi:signal transduction histidine kinase
VLFWQIGDSLRVTLRDNGAGAGAGPAAEGIGIRGMRERFGKLGGTIEAGSFPGGFKVEAEVPLRT